MPLNNDLTRKKQNQGQEKESKHKRQMEKPQGPHPASLPAACHRSSFIINRHSRGKASLFAKNLRPLSDSMTAFGKANLITSDSKLGTQGPDSQKGAEGHRKSQEDFSGSSASVSPWGKHTQQPPNSCLFQHLDQSFSPE